MSKHLREFGFITLGIASAAFGLESFLLPNKFIDGGVTGISLLISGLSGVHLGILLVIINLPFVWLGSKVIDRVFAFKTAFAIGTLSIVLATVHFPEITHDKLLVAVFGGFFLGLGIGLAIRGGAVLDGTEVLAIFLSRKLHTSIGDFIISLNVIIFAVAAYLLSIEQALYSMITYLVASKALDFVIEGIEEYTSITIISTNSLEIRQMIISELGRGVTVYKGRGGYQVETESREFDILYTVVTRLEVNRLYTEVGKIDSNAFIVTNRVKDIKGGIIKKRPLNH
jgi:uncharacterized membrane-anchored protein YitT (DUF2179 family)